MTQASQSHSYSTQKAIGWVMLGIAYVLLAWITVGSMSQIQKYGSSWNIISYLMLLLPHYFILSLTGSYLHKSLQKAALSITLVSVLFFFMAIVEAGRREPLQSTIVAVAPFCFLMLLTAGVGAWLYYLSNDPTWKLILFRYLPCVPVLLTLLFLAAEGSTWPETRHKIIYGLLCFTPFIWTLYIPVSYKNSLKDLKPRLQKAVVILRCVSFVAFFLSIAVSGLRMHFAMKPILEQSAQLNEIALLYEIPPPFSQDGILETKMRMGLVIFVLNIISVFLLFLMERKNFLELKKTQELRRDSPEIESANA